ncbi:MAG TPA: C-type lectin domain-containing protein [Kofleriaceae bacterium]|nr:C-type lectin domain-containing protein [Kofleriaceae bacterium]
MRQRTRRAGGTRFPVTPAVARAVALAVALAAAQAGCSSTIVGDQAPADAGGAAADASIADASSGGAPDSSTADAAAAVPDAALPCDQGDNRIEDTASGACYMFFASPLSWDDARAACAALGGHLAALTTLAENELASRIALAEEIWIGASDTFSENSFVWVTGEPFAFDHWRQGEPNNGGDDGEDCAVIEGDNNIPGEGCLWDDRACPTPSPYLCERP